MPRCNINLAKGIIWPRRRRVLIYRIIMTYLAVMMLLLIGISIHTFSQVQEGINWMRQSQAIEKEFIRQHPHSPDLTSYSRGLKKQIEKDSARIASIGTVLPQTVHSILPALVILANQPDQRMLNQLTLTQLESGSTQVLLDLMVPESASRNGSATQDFVRKWQEDPHLAEYFPQLQPVRSLREKIRGEAVYITQYKAIGED